MRIKVGRPIEPAITAVSLFYIVKREDLDRCLGTDTKLPVIAVYNGGEIANTELVSPIKTVEQVQENHFNLYTVNHVIPFPIVLV